MPKKKQGGKAKKRGFAAMSPEKRREAGARGGRQAHAVGNANEWDSDKAREMGARGGREAHAAGTAYEWDSAQASEAARKSNRAQLAKKEGSSA